MAKLSDLASSLRSKNAGPFWVTVDIFFDDPQAFDHTATLLQNSQVAAALKLPESVLKRFDLRGICVIKFSFPRPVVQGNRFDRDMHGAQYAWVLADLVLVDSEFEPQYPANDV